LHERFASWLERAFGERAREVEEIIGYHLEQAVRYRSELGPTDEGARSLAERAGIRLGSAGRRAAARGDASATVNLLRRACSLLPDEHALRLELLFELVSGQIKAGDFTDAKMTLTEAAERAADTGDERLELRGQIEWGFLKSFTDPEGSGSSAELLRIAESAIPRLEALDDARGLAKAWWLLSEVHVIAGRFAARADALERALGYARRASDQREEMTVIGLLAQALCYGPTPVPDAIRRCERLLADARGDRSVEAAVAGALAVLLAMRGDIDDARTLCARARAIYDELGLNYRRAARSLAPAMVELLAGDPAAAERELRWGYETLAAMGEKGARSTLAAFLARTVYAQGRHREAEELAQASAEAAGSDDLVTQSLWRATQAMVLAQRREAAAAEPLAREALRIARQTDFLGLQADTLMSLAEVLRLAGRGDEASPLVAATLEVCERKGNVVAARTASALLSASVR
jgi:tetratricopeptide (TPR) repeat protein